MNRQKSNSLGFHHQMQEAGVETAGQACPVPSLHQRQGGLLVSHQPEYKS